MLVTLYRRLSAEECLLNHNRNPELSREEIEDWLQRMLGVQVRHHSGDSRLDCRQRSARGSDSRWSRSTSSDLLRSAPAVPAAENNLAAQGAGGG